MTVEIPDALRRAMELRGVDPDDVAEKAAAISESGVLDEPESLTGVVPPPEDEPEPLFDPRDANTYERPF